MRRGLKEAGLEMESSAHRNETEQDTEYAKQEKGTNKGGYEKENKKVKQ